MVVAFPDDIRGLSTQPAYRSAYFSVAARRNLSPSSGMEIRGSTVASRTPWVVTGHYVAS